MQAYIGRNAKHGEIKPHEYRKNPNDAMVIQMPIEPFLLDT